MADTGKKRNKVCFWIGILILAVAFLLVEVYVYHTVRYTLNSDDASELMLAEMLAKEGRIITRNWYYSTEIRLLNTQLIFAPLFLLSHEWLWIRCIGTAILHIILLSSAYLLCKKLRCTRFFPFAGLMLILPFSEDYLEVVVKIPYYIPHIAISFCSIALSIAFISSRKRKKKATAILCASFLLSLISGLGGPRQVLICYLPMLLCAVCLLILQNRHNVGFSELRSDGYFLFLLYALVCVVGAGSGYLLNTHVLSRYYHYRIYHFDFVRFDYERFFNILAGIFRVLGYRSGPLNAVNLLSNATCAFYVSALLYCIVTGLSSRRGISFEYRMLAMYTLCSILAYMLLYSLTDMVYVDRYILPIVVFIIPLMACGMEDFCRERGPITVETTKDLGEEQKRVRWIRATAAALTVVWIILTASSSLQSFLRWQEETKEPTERMGIVDALSDLGYENGYATFWNANVLTELSNGRIRMHDWCDATGGQIKRIVDIDTTYKWLQPVSNDTERPAGKVFLFFSYDEFDDFVWKMNLREGNRIISTENYLAYGFENYQEMIESVYRDYSFTFEDSEWLSEGGGYDADGARLISPGGLSRGPYITFCKGKYRVTIRGYNLSKGDYRCTYDYGNKSLNRKMRKNTNREIIYEVNCGSELHNVETVIENISDVDMVITEIKIHRL